MAIVNRKHGITLNVLFSFTLAMGLIALSIIGYMLMKEDREKSIKKWQTDMIQKSSAATSSYYASLITKIVLGKSEEVDDMLSVSKSGENLLSISIIPQTQITPYILETCEVDATQSFFHQVPTCFESTNNAFIIYHELRSTGYNVGYLMKRVALPQIGLFSNRTFLIHISIILACFIFMNVLILFTLQRFLIQPIKAMIGLLRCNEGIRIEPSVYAVSELKSLALTFRDSFQSIAEYQLKTTKLEYEARIGGLASAVAHDIRSPLSSLKASGDLLKRIVDGNEEGREALNLLKLSGNRLNDIANGLLAKHSGEAAVDKVFSIHEILDELIGELRVSPLGVGTEFKKQYHSSALYINGDKTGINRAIGNIIKNALEAMQKNPIDRSKQLVVATTCHPEPKAKDLDSSAAPQNDSVIIRITDTGPGIPADKIPLILRGGHTEGKADGHGIGTTVVNEVVTAHKGTLNIESEIGVGTTFIITLPATDQHEDMTVTISRDNDGNIIVIDDEASMREQWRLTLKTQGIVPQIYSCWEEYEQSSAPLTPTLSPKGRGANDTFIMDYQFNNSTVDGLEIIRRLQSKGHTQFVLASAEYWKPDIKEAAKELNVTLCPKPLPRVVVEQTSSSPQCAASESGDPAVEPNSGSPLPLNPNAGTITGPSILLIDDDPAMHIAWKMMCKLWRVKGFQAFLSMEDCAQSEINFTAVDAAFIDKNITGSAWALDKTITHLKSSGVRRVWVASGESTKDLQSDPLCAAADGVVKGKMPESLEGYLN